MHVPFDLHVPIAVCRHAELGCTARLSEVTSLSQAVALTKPSVVWLINLQSSLREKCPPWIVIAYTVHVYVYGRIQAVGVTDCRINKNGGQSEKRKLKIKLLCALSGTHKLKYDEFHPYPPV